VAALPQHRAASVGAGASRLRDGAPRGLAGFPGRCGSGRARVAPLAMGGCDHQSGAPEMSRFGRFSCCVTLRAVGFEASGR
jgi:hypothetical protein